MKGLPLDTDKPVCQTDAVFHIGDVVKKLRHDRGFTLTELAKRAGINKGTLSALENGGNSTLVTIRKVAAALGVTADQLHDRVGRPPMELPTFGQAAASVQSIVSGAAVSPRAVAVAQAFERLGESDKALVEGMVARMLAGAAGA